MSKNAFFFPFVGTTKLQRLFRIIKLFHEILEINLFFFDFLQKDTIKEFSFENLKFHRKFFKVFFL